MESGSALAPEAIVELFVDISTQIRSGLDELVDWGRADGHPGQYSHDVVADDIAIPMLSAAGMGVVSEESEPTDLHRDIVAVIDPIDGSTNASIGLPWYATSICAVDADGPLAAVVVNQALGTTYTAIRGAGSWRDGVRISPTGCQQISDGILVFNDLPPKRLGWRQYRVMGAAALDLCAVADGTFDGFIDFGEGLAAWDYLGAWLVCHEAGASIAAIGDADLLEVVHGRRIGLVAGATPEMTADLRAAVR